MRPAHAIRPELRRRGFVISTILYIVIMVIATALFVSFGYKLIFKEESNPGSSTQLPPDVQDQKADTIDETAEWKTYQNKEWGFQLSYPPNFNIQEDSSFLVPTLVITAPEREVSAMYSTLTVSFLSTNYLKEFEEIKKQKFVDSMFQSVGETSPSTLNGEPAKKFIRDRSTADEFSLISGLYADHNGNGYAISTEVVFGDELNVLDQILSTFKFTN